MLRAKELRSLRPKNEEIGGKGIETIYDALRPNGFEGVITNTNKIGFQPKMEDGELGRELRFTKCNKRNVWDSFPSQPPVCGGDDGIPKELDGIAFSKWREESLKAYGNAIVPQVAYQIFKSISLYPNI
jgi:DNA (cytosine-5)-methyltransferase 1